MIDNPKTVTDLAALLNVNRRRITKWRTDEQAPQDLDLNAWRDWLALTGRTILKDRLQAATAPLGEPENHDGAKAAALNDEAPTPPPIVGEWDKPEQSAGPALWEKHYKALSAKQDAANKERAAKIADRDLIPAEEVKIILRAMAVAMLAAIGDHVWLGIRPHLDGMPDTARKNLRTAHDQALIGVRQRLSAALIEHFAKITNPPNQSA